MYQKVGAFLSITHLLFVIYFSWVIANAPDSEASMAWVLFLFLDFPVIFGLEPVGVLMRLIGVPKYIEWIDVSGQLRDVYSFWLPAFYTGVIGTTWWYFLPILIGKLFGSKSDSLN